MSSTLLRSVWRGGLFAGAAGIIILLSLAAYCAVDTATYVSSAQQVTGIIVDIEKPVFEKQRQDFRPVVEVTLPSGETFTERFSGLYRVPADAVGQPIALLHNATAPPTVIPDSHLNWIGSFVYGSASLVLLVSLGLFWCVGRWLPPAQVAENVTPETL